MGTSATRQGFSARRSPALVIACILLGASALVAQGPASPPAANPASPSITFEFSLPGATPSHYSLVLEGSGRAIYRSSGEGPRGDGAAGEDPAKAEGAAPAGEGDAPLEFTMSQAARQQAFALAERLKYFDGNFDYKKGRIANMGAKSLTYADPMRHFTTHYNYSQNPDLQQLTALFQGVSSTLEYGRELEFRLRFDKLGLAAVLQRMAEASDAGQLAELQAIAQTLQKVSADPGVLRMARVNADRLLARASEASSPATPR